MAAGNTDMAAPMAAAANTDVAAAIGSTVQEWEVHLRGQRFQVHGVHIPTPLPLMEPNVPLGDLNITVCMDLVIQDLCLHVAKKQKTGEPSTTGAHPPAAHTEAPAAGVAVAANVTGAPPKSAHPTAMVTPATSPDTAEDQAGTAQDLVTNLPSVATDDTQIEEADTPAHEADTSADGSLDIIDISESQR